MAAPAASKRAVELAADLEVDTAEVKGSGKGGRIVVKDIRAAAKAKPLTVVAGVERDLTAIAKRDPELARSGQAASALTLARQLDDSSNSATSKSMCSRALNETLERLRDLAPPKQAEDGVDKLAAKRNARRRK